MTFCGLFYSVRYYVLFSLSIVKQNEGEATYNRRNSVLVRLCTFVLCTNNQLQKDVKHKFEYSVLECIFFLQFIQFYSVRYYVLFSLSIVKQNEGEATYNRRNSVLVRLCTFVLCTNNQLQKDVKHKFEYSVLECIFFLQFIQLRVNKF